MPGVTRISNIIRRAGSRRAVPAKIFRFAIAAGALSSPLLFIQAIAPSAEAAQLNATARIQALLDNPVNGVVNLPPGTFTIRPALRLQQAETIIGHNTTLTVAASSGDYAAVLQGASPGTNLSGLSITGVNFNQNASANPITNVQTLYHGQPRFVILVSNGTGISITNNKFLNTNNVDTVVTGSATSQVTISGNQFTGVSTPWHDHSSVYTSGTGTTITNNTFSGTYDVTAIEVHGDQATVTGNNISGYDRAINVVCSDTTFSKNTVTRALGPVDLWSVVAPGLHDVAVTGNTLSQDLTGWARQFKSLGLPMPSAPATQQVFQDVSSTYPFVRITISGNRS